MKIIKKGIHPDNVEYEATCRYSGTVFSFSKKEARHHAGDYRSDAFLQIDCPICNKQVRTNV